MEETLDKDNDLEYVFGKNAGDDDEDEEEDDEADTKADKNPVKSSGGKNATRVQDTPSGRPNKTEKLGKRRPTKMLEIEEDGDVAEAVAVTERGFRN